MKLRYILFGVMFTMMLAVCGLMIIFMPPRKYSENENRYLKAEIDVTLDNLLSGKVQSDISDFMSDQFPLRDALTSISSFSHITFGARDIGGAYIGKDGYYIEKILDTDYNYDRYKRNLRFVNEFAKTLDIPVSVVMVPPVGVVMKDKLPTYAVMFDAQRVYSEAFDMLTNCDVYDIRMELTDDDEKTYFRTDHHWTVRGAAVCYKMWAHKHGFEFANPKYTVIADKFLGTQYSKVLLKNEYDIVEIADTVSPISVMADGEIISVYDKGALKRKDKYEVFFGGNYGVVEIECDNLMGDTILVVKDSYANCFVPYMIEDYNRIVMVDLRYCAMRISDIINEYGIDEVLVLYGIADFASESSVARIGA